MAPTSIPIPRDTPHHSSEEEGEEGGPPLFLPLPEEEAREDGGGGGGGEGWFSKNLGVWERGEGVMEEKEERR
jgi:hypothetical protein